MSFASRSRADLESISCPQTALRSEWTTVAVRIGRIPPMLRTAFPMSGSSRKRRRNSPWSSSAARTKRSLASASSGSSLSIHALSFPSGFCETRASAGAPPAS